MAQSSYQKIELTEDIELSWPFSYTGAYIVCDINDIEPDADNHKIKLPAANLTGPGQNFIFNNITDKTLTIVANDGTDLDTIAGNTIIECYLTNASTTNGTWKFVPYGGGATGIASLTIASSDSSISVSNGAISSTGSTVDLKLPASISNLNKLKTDGGFPVITNSNPLQWSTVDLVAGNNIRITNSDGIQGDPEISLSDTLEGLASVEVGDMTLSGEVITNNIVDGNIQLNTNGEGKVYINGVAVSADGDLILSKSLDINTLAVGDLILSGDEITNKDTNGNVQLNTSGNGEVLINGMSVDEDGVLTVGNLVLSKNKITNNTGGDLVFNTSNTGSRVTFNGAFADKEGNFTVKYLSLYDNKITNNSLGGSIYLTANGVGKVIIDGEGGLEISKLHLSGSTIASAISNNNMQLTTSGTGKVLINNKVIIDSNGDLTVDNLKINKSFEVNNIAIAGTINNPLMPRIYCTFIDNGGTISAVDQVGIELKDGHANIIRQNNGTYKLSFAEELQEENYGVIITLGGAIGENVKFGRYITRDQKYVTIGITDLSGLPSLDVSEGVTIMIMSSKGFET